MNVINKILGKDVSSIIFKYLIKSKKEIHLNHLKMIGYIHKRLYVYSHINDHNYTARSIKLDQYHFHMYYVWNYKLNKWEYI